MAFSSPSAGGSPSPAPETSEQPKPARNKQAHLLLALLVIGLCLWVISGAVVFGVCPHVAAKYHWEQAKKALVNNDLARAENHLAECLKVWSNDGEVQFAMARTSRRTGKLDQAFEHLEPCIGAATEADADGQRLARFPLNAFHNVSCPPSGARLPVRLKPDTTYEEIADC